MKTVISLFSGAVDGLAIAFQTAGFRVTHHVEIDAWGCEVLRMNHPDSTVINADIKTVKGLPYADVIVGGAPCQDFSVAGKRAGFSGERYLWPEMRRLVGEGRPGGVVFENVYGGVSAGLLDRVCTDLESDGYTAWPLVYPANGLRKRLSQPRLGRNAYGTAAALHRLNPARDFPGFPAGQESFQYDYEPARITQTPAPDAKRRIEALGNAVVWQQAYPIALALKEWLT